MPRLEKLVAALEEIAEAAIWVAAGLSLAVQDFRERAALIVIRQTFEAQDPDKAFAEIMRLARESVRRQEAAAEAKVHAPGTA